MLSICFRRCGGYGGGETDGMTGPSSVTVRAWEASWPGDAGGELRRRLGMENKQ
jgi:hypothetical protein